MTVVARIDELSAALGAVARFLSVLIDPMEWVMDRN